MIRKVKQGWRVIAESGRNMGIPLRQGYAGQAYKTKRGAKARLRQIEVFKHLKKRRRRK